MKKTLAMLLFFSSFVLVPMLALTQTHLTSTSTPHLHPQPQPPTFTLNLKPFTPMSLQPKPLFTLTPQPLQEVLKALSWTVYKDKGGSRPRAWVEKRIERILPSFMEVWKDEPLWKQRLALAVCLKETLCGLNGPIPYRGRGLNADGSQDCGLTQVNSKYTKYSCRELASSLISFREQRRMLETIVLKYRVFEKTGEPPPRYCTKKQRVVGKGKCPSPTKLSTKYRKDTIGTWLKRVSFYNGSGPSARAYGKKIKEYVKQ
jgi:hypothetical protein